MERLTYSKSLLNYTAHACYSRCLFMVIVLLVPTSLFVSGCEYAKYVAGEGKTGETYLVAIKDLHPTQAVVGEREVKEKTDKINGMGDAKLKDYIEEKTVPVVIGPDNVLYMIDHHHTMLALLRSGRSDTCLAKVVANFSEDNVPAFWQEMEKKHWVYLKNGQGQTITPLQIPAHLSQLQNDPYRSLAGTVRDLGGFNKSKKPFAEFAWANYFRSRVQIGEGQGAWDEAVKQAMAIAHDSAASKLPGYIAK